MATVLIVDDESYVLVLVARVLRQRLGFTDDDILQVRDSSQAEGLVRAHPELKLIICDTSMPPGLTGPQVHASVATFLAEHGIKFLPMSGGHIEDAQLYYGPGIEVLTKPFTPDSLEAIVRRLLDMPRAPTK